MAYINLFRDAGWNGSGEVIELGTLTTRWFGTGTYRIYHTFDKAIAGSVAGDTVAPCPPMSVNGTTYNYFTDANGIQAQTVVVDIKGNVSKESVNVSGGAFRLRFTGNYVLRLVGAAYTDCDFNAKTFPSYGASSLKSYYYRCTLCGVTNALAAYMYHNFYDSLVWGNSRYSLNNERVRLYRSTSDEPGRNVYNNVHYQNNSVNIHGLTQSEIAALGFAGEPKAIDSDNYGYYTDGTAWSATDWEDWDARLTSASPSEYLTGNGVASADLPVYDLAGLPRGVDGAQGAYAYEATSGVDAVFHLVQEAYRYFKIENAADGPQISDFYVGSRSNSSSGSSCFTTWFDEKPPYKVKVGRPDGEWGATFDFDASTPSEPTWHDATGWQMKFDGSWGWTTFKYQYLDADDSPVGSPSYVYVGATKGTGYLPNPRFNQRGNWKSPTTGAPVLPTSSSTVLIDQNVDFASSGATVGKVIVGGWAHPNFGDAEVGEVVFGKDATVASCGKLTLKDETNTDAEIWAKITAESGLKLTLEDCATSDAT